MAKPIMNIRSLFVVFLFNFCSKGLSADFTWKSDNVITSISSISGASVLNLSASHLVLPAEHTNWGHYALQVNNETTPCLDWHTSEEDLIKALDSLPGIINRGGISVISTVENYGYTHTISMKNDTEIDWLLESFSIQRESPTRGNKFSIASSYLTNVYNNENIEQIKQLMKPCDAVRTWGEWDDATQWEEGIIPGSKIKMIYSDSDTSSFSHVKAIDITSANDYIIIPKESGFIQMTSNIVIGGLLMNGGNIVTMSSGCPSGWSKPSHSNNGNRNIKNVERDGIYAGNNIEYNLNNLKQNKQFGFNDQQKKCFAAFYGPSKNEPLFSNNKRYNGVGNNKFNNNIFNDNHDNIKIDEENDESSSSFDWSKRPGYLHNEVDENRGVTWNEAEDICRIISPGDNGHLVSIESYAENELVKTLCQGLHSEKLEIGYGDEVFRSSIQQSDEDLIGLTSNKKRRKSVLNGEDRDINGIDSDRASKILGDDGSQSLAQAKDPRCWIGLRDENLNGRWLWPDEKGMASTTWRSWARHQPDNRSTEITGESCAVMSSSLYSIERQHIGEWQDERCDSNFAFVCERSSISKGYNLIIGGLGLVWKGGVFSGGGHVRNLGPAYVSSSSTDNKIRDSDVFSSDSTNNYFNDDEIDSISAAAASSLNDWRYGGSTWLQGLNEIGLTDAVHVEFYGQSVIEENTVITAGDGAVLAIIDKNNGRHVNNDDNNDAQNEFISEIYQNHLLKSQWWPSEVPWYIHHDFYSSSLNLINDDENVKYDSFLNKILNNENTTTALYIKSNVTLRSMKGHGPLWELPSIPEITNSGGGGSNNNGVLLKEFDENTKTWNWNDQSNQYYNNNNITDNSISFFANNALRQSKLKSNRVMKAWSDSIQTPASSHDSAMRGVMITGSGKVKTTLPVTGSGRRPRLLNRAKVWFIGDEGDSEVQWFYEAGQSGRSTNATATFNSTGILVANSTIAKLTLAGGGIATGGSSMSVRGGLELSNFTLALSSSPTFILAVSAEQEVINEERSWNIISNEKIKETNERHSDATVYPDPTNAMPSTYRGDKEQRSYGINGTYRIAVKHPFFDHGVVAETKCLPYHSTAQQVEAALSELESVRELGGAIVTRDGDPTSPRWGYGYKYKIVFDVANEINNFGMTAGDRNWLRSTSGGGGGSSSSMGSLNQAPWAWDLEAGIMSNGRRLYNEDEDESYDKDSIRNMTNLHTKHTDVYISCQGSQKQCGCSELLTFLNTNDNEMMNKHATNHNDNHRENQFYKTSLNSNNVHNQNHNFKTVQTSASSDQIVKSFGYQGQVCRAHQDTSREDIYSCMITPRITLSLLHGGGQSYLHDGALNATTLFSDLSSATSSSSQEELYDEPSRTTTTQINDEDSSQSRRGKKTKSMISITGGVHRLPSLLAGSLGVEVTGGTSYIISRNFTASYIYLGVNETQFRNLDDGDNDGIDDSPFLRDGGVNGTGGLGKLGGGLGGHGLLVCAGAGFSGLDNALLLYEGPERHPRSYLRHTPFHGNIAGMLSIENGGELRIATMDHKSSGFTTSNFLMDSGSMLSGWATTKVMNKLIIRGSFPKRYRIASSLICDHTCTGEWKGSGPVWFSEGSNFINRGTFELSAYRLDRDVAEFVLQDNAENTSNPRGGYGPGNSYGGGTDGYGSGGRLGVETRNDVDFGYDASRESWVQTEQFNNGNPHDLGGGGGGYWYNNPLCGKHCSQAPYFINTKQGILKILEKSNPRIGLFLRNLGSIHIMKEGRLSAGGGGDGDGSYELRYGSVFRIFGGIFNMDGAATTMVHRSNSSDENGVTGDVWGGMNGTVEVSGGGPHQLADVFDGPRLNIYGGEVEVRSRFHDLRGGLSIHGGSLTYSISSTRAFIAGENFTMTGGTMQFVEILPHAAIHPNNIHNQVRNADRSYLTLTSEFLWSGGTLKGNAEIGAREDVRIGEELSPLAVGSAWISGYSSFANQHNNNDDDNDNDINNVDTSYSQALGRKYGSYSAAAASLKDLLPYYPQESMRIESLLHLISYKRTRWFKGDVITSKGGSFIEAGVTWMEDPKYHTSRILSEPLPEEYHNRKHLLTMWEDNEASMHQDFGGFA